MKAEHGQKKWAKTWARTHIDMGIDMGMKMGKDMGIGTSIGIGIGTDMVIGRINVGNWVREGVIKVQYALDSGVVAI